MQKRDLVIGAVILAIIALVVFFIQRRRQEVGVLPTPTPISQSAAVSEQQIEDKFKIDIPDDMEKTNLQDVTGNGNSAIATRNFESGTFNMTVLADLPDPEAGKVYQVWLRKDTETRPLGTMRIAKGGFLLDLTTREDLRSFTSVIISEEAKDDNTIETTVLQGSF